MPAVLRIAGGTESIFIWWRGSGESCRMVGKATSLPAASPVTPGAQAAPEESSVILLAILSTKRDDFLLTSATTALLTQGAIAHPLLDQIPAFSIPGDGIGGEVRGVRVIADADCLTVENAIICRCESPTQIRQESRFPPRSEWPSRSGIRSSLPCHLVDQTG